MIVVGLRRIEVNFPFYGKGLQGNRIYGCEEPTCKTSQMEDKKTGGCVLSA
jgi:hypothetical protein